MKIEFKINKKKKLKSKSVRIFDSTKIELN